MTDAERKAQTKGARRVSQYETRHPRQMRDLRYAVRNLRTTPFVNAVAILSLALGIGANAAIYSLFEQILLRPLPVAAPHELVTLNLPGPIQGNDSCNQSGCGNGIIWSYPMLRDVERRSEEHTSELQSLAYLVCRLLLEKKN